MVFVIKINERRTRRSLELSSNVFFLYDRKLSGPSFNELFFDFDQWSNILSDMQIL